MMGALGTHLVLDDTQGELEASLDDSQNHLSLEGSQKVIGASWTSIQSSSSASHMTQIFTEQENLLDEERQDVIECYVANAEPDDTEIEWIENVRIDIDDKLCGYCISLLSIREYREKCEREKNLNRLRALVGYRKSRSDSTGSYDAYRNLQVQSSIDLLRASIVRSIRERARENQGFLERKFDGSNSQPAQYSGPKYTVVEVSSSHSLDDAESDLSDSERKDTTKEGNTKLAQRRHTPEGCVVQTSPSEQLGILSDKSSIQSSNAEETPASLVIRDEKEDSKDQRRAEMNNFILARRKFNDSIFQDCSTYDITCPTIHLRDVNDKCSQLINSQKHTHQSSTASLCSTEENGENSSTLQSSATNVNEHADDHSALCDTFLTHVLGGEQSSTNLQNDHSILDGRSTLVERDLNTAEVAESDVAIESSVLPVKRKFSRRHRKRSRKKSKSKKSYVYECSKCGVSYFTPTKAMNNVACCLHCDLWTPVEPVFVKTEKTTWNTCRIS